MSESNTESRDSGDQELQRLAAIPDDDIDTSDAREVTDWGRAERGRFYRPGAAANIPLYLDLDVAAFLKERAPALGIPLNDLANEMLKKQMSSLGLASSIELVVCTAKPDLRCSELVSSYARYRSPLEF